MSGTPVSTARHQELIEELCAASIRALAGERDLHFRARRLHRGRRALPAYAPHLHPSLDDDDFGSFRGAADGYALRLRVSDAELHARLRPDDPIERALFDLLEQFRVEAAVPPGMPGVAANLRHAFEAWSRAFYTAGKADTARGLLIFTIALICRARVTGHPPPEDLEDPLEATRAGIAPIVGHALAALRRTRDDQAAYAEPAREIARIVAQMLREGDGAATADGGDAERDDDAERAAFSLLVDPDAELTERFASAVSGRSRVLDDAPDGYRIYTAAYDRERDAATLARAELLREYREKLDAAIAAQNLHVGRLARELQALLALPERDGWDSAQEEGIVDGRRLAQLVASPTERRLFRTERTEPRADAVLTFLIDCSGSMKEHVEKLATLIDVFVRALEQAGIASEVLGYTTGAWNGGRAMRDWVRAGRPPHPGRLNERCHLVFKHGDSTWRRARPAIAALLKGDLFREGLDGEAVQWAHARLVARSETRKLLLVVSDGSPMDSATNLANDAHYLDHHLLDEVQKIEAAGRVAVYGVGVGLDLSPYYSASHVLDLAGSTPQQAMRELLDLLARPHRR